jgi:hypothetical protein
MAYIRSNRVDPRDFQINTAIGVALPFNAPGVFNSVYSTRDQVKYNLINLIMTSQGERIENPNFGTILKQQLFNQISELGAFIEVPTSILTLLTHSGIFILSFSNDFFKTSLTILLIFFTILFLLF